MKLRIIETDQYWLAISDGEIKEGDNIYADGGTWNGTITQCAGMPITECWKKIHAYQPKGNAPKLDLSLLPEMVVEDDKFELFLDNEIKLKLSPKETIERIKWYYQTYFKASTKVYTEEDLFKCAVWFVNNFNLFNCSDENNELFWKNNKDKFIQSLKQPKTPTYFLLERIENNKCIGKYLFE